MRRPAVRRPSRIPSRISLVDVLLWLLGGSIILFAVVEAFLTLQSTNLTFEDWRNLVIFGVAQGSIYALIALGYTWSTACCS